MSGKKGPDFHAITASLHEAANQICKGDQSAALTGLLITAVEIGKDKGADDEFFVRALVHAISEVEQRRRMAS